MSTVTPAHKEPQPGEGPPEALDETLEEDEPEGGTTDGEGDPPPEDFRIPAGPEDPPAELASYGEGSQLDLEEPDEEVDIDLDDSGEDDLAQLSVSFPLDTTADTPPKWLAAILRWAASNADQHPDHWTTKLLKCGEYSVSEAEPAAQGFHKGKRTMSLFVEASKGTKIIAEAWTSFQSRDKCWNLRHVLGGQAPDQIVTPFQAKNKGGVQHIMVTAKHNMPAFSLNMLKAILTNNRHPHYETVGHYIAQSCAVRKPKPAGTLEGLVYASVAGEAQFAIPVHRSTQARNFMLNSNKFKYKIRGRTVPLEITFTTPYWTCSRCADKHSRGAGRGHLSLHKATCARVDKAYASKKKAKRGTTAAAAAQGTGGTAGPSY
jgi:hypothetical protein